MHKAQAEGFVILALPILATLQALGSWKGIKRTLRDRYFQFWCKFWWGSPATAHAGTLGMLRLLIGAQTVHSVELSARANVWGAKFGRGTSAAVMILIIALSQDFLDVRKYYPFYVRPASCPMHAAL
jgi:hypothetical protein